MVFRRDFVITSKREENLMNQKNRDIENRYLIKLISRINQLSIDNKDVFPADIKSSSEDCREKFIKEMNDYMWNSNILGCSRIVSNSYFVIKSLDLQTEYRMEYSKDKQEIILFLANENYSYGRYKFNTIELTRYSYNEYKKAINLMEQINSIVLEERERKNSLKRIKYEINNVKLCEIAKSAVKAARLTHKRENFFIRSFCSNYQGYILLSPDGINLYIIFIVLKDCEKNLQTVLNLCASPEKFLLSNNIVECFPICTRNLDFEKLKKIEKEDEILHALYDKDFRSID